MGSRVGYAVVGLGHIAQDAVLPAFVHAQQSSRLVALVSSDERKLRAVGDRYGVDKRFSYAEFDQCLANPAVDAVYIALPNTQHAEYTIRAANAGVHVLCEKPMAVSEQECVAMIRACRENDVRLMIAYRLHFDPANLEAVAIAESGRLGQLRLFDSAFSYQVKEGNIRTQASLGGGPLFDIGIYCVNAARYLFQDEPIEVSAFAAMSNDPRFKDVEEAATAVLRFSNERLATFMCSYAAAPVASYRLVGTKGLVELDRAYEYTQPMVMRATIDEKTHTRRFARHDQFAPELIEFSRCVLESDEPEPSGLEGLADVRVIEGLNRSIDTGRAVRLVPVSKVRHPQPWQAMQRPPVRPPKPVHAAPPHD